MSENTIDKIKVSLATLTKAEPEQLQTQAVTALIVALGSNYQADYYLAVIRKKLAELGEIMLSTAFQNPDFTATLAQPKPDYINQCVYISLAKTMTLEQLQQIFKGFEADCHRQRLPEPSGIKPVTMDIDMLLITMSTDDNSLSNESLSKWTVLLNRYPFKTHELIGIKELMTAK